jgi:hypothetical protein
MKSPRDKKPVKLDKEDRKLERMNARIMRKNRAKIKLKKDAGDVAI